MTVNSGLTKVTEPATVAVCGARAGTMHNKSSEHMALAFWLAARGLLGSILLPPLHQDWGGASEGVAPPPGKGKSPCHAPLPCTREPSPLASIPNEYMSAHVMG